MGHEMENAESKMDSTLKKMAKVLHMSNGKCVLIIQLVSIIHKKKTRKNLGSITNFKKRLE